MLRARGRVSTGAASLVRQGALAMGAAVAAFVATSPFVLLDLRDALAGLGGATQARLADLLARASAAEAGR